MLGQQLFRTKLTAVPAEEELDGLADKGGCGGGEGKADGELMIGLGELMMDFGRDGDRLDGELMIGLGELTNFGEGGDRLDTLGDTLADGLLMIGTGDGDTGEELTRELLTLDRPTADGDGAGETRLLGLDGLGEEILSTDLDTGEGLETMLVLLREDTDELTSELKKELTADRLTEESDLTLDGELTGELDTSETTSEETTRVDGLRIEDTGEDGTEETTDTGLTGDDLTGELSGESELTTLLRAETLDTAGKGTLEGDTLGLRMMGGGGGGPGETGDTLTGDRLTLDGLTSDTLRLDGLTPDGLLADTLTTEGERKDGDSEEASDDANDTWDEDTLGNCRGPQQARPTANNGSPK
jgi:hypothetical protein